MCKVMMIAGIKKQHQAKVQKLVKEMAKEMARFEEDGVGYAAITSSGKIYGEKWIHKDDAFSLYRSRDADPIHKDMTEIFSEAGEFKVEPSDNLTYEAFGESKKDTVAIILHARKKTIGEKTIENTHPFVVINDDVHPDTALIHNGSIKNHEQLTKKFSTCDSEVILHEYLDNQMYYNPWAISSVSDRLKGQYTVGVLSSMTEQDETITPILDIFKSNKDLWVAFVKEIDSYVFSTSDTTLENATKALNFTVSHMMKIVDGNYLRLNAITGKRVMDIIKFSKSIEYFYEGYLSKEKLPVPFTKEKETTEEAKADFTNNHPELFGQPYYDIVNKLSPEEIEFYNTLEKNKTTNLRALHLVNAVLSKRA